VTVPFGEAGPYATFRARVIDSYRFASRQQILSDLAEVLEDLRDASSVAALLLERRFHREPVSSDDPPYGVWPPS
jgi:hypothetical protein